MRNETGFVSVPLPPPKTALDVFGQGRTGFLAVVGSLDRPFGPARLFGDFAPSDSRNICFKDSSEATAKRLCLQHRQARDSLGFCGQDCGSTPVPPRSPVWSAPVRANRQS